jgi:RES domain-containing protein
LRLIRTVYRAHNPRWAFAPESGDGAALTGGRFNSRGTRALYASFRFETAWLEAQQAFPFKAQPLTLCAYEVECDDVLDLTDQGILTGHGIAQSDLSCAWKDLETRGIRPPSWILAERLMRDGIAGVVVPTYESGATAADNNVISWDWDSGPPYNFGLSTKSIGFRRMPVLGDIRSPLSCCDAASDDRSPGRPSGAEACLSSPLTKSPRVDSLLL